MALLLIDGFDHYANTYVLNGMGGKWTTLSGQVFHSNTTLNSLRVRTGAGALQISSTSGSLSHNHVLYTLPAISNTVTIGFAVKHEYSTSPTPGSSLFTAVGSLVTLGLGSIGLGSVQVTLGFLPSGQLVVERSNGVAGDYPGGDRLATSQRQLKFRKWNYVEWMITCNNTTGNTEVRLNDEIVISATGLDTQALTNSSIDTVALVATNVSTPAYYDDVYIRDDATFMGQSRVITLLASTGNGAMTDFATSTGTDHGALVDDAVPDDDTTYTYSNTANTVDTYAFPALTTGNTIKAVQISATVRKTDISNTTIAALAVRANSTNYFSSNVYVTQEYLTYTSTYEQNPNTSASWTISELDNAEFGVKRVI